MPGTLPLATLYALAREGELDREIVSEALEDLEIDPAQGQPPARLTLPPPPRRSRMATELKLPDLGEGIADADVLSVLVSAGQAVVKDDPIIEIESDKATLEVPAELAGTVTQILVSAGDTLQVGQTILELEEGDSAADGKPVATPPPAKASAGTVTDAPAPTPAPAHNTTETST